MRADEIMTRVKRQFGDESAVQITDDDLLRWINDAQKEIARNNHLLETKKVADIIVAQSEYSLPTDMLELWAVRWNNYKLKSMSMEEADEYITNTEDSQNYQQGSPGVYWQWQNVITLYPIPDTGIVNGLAIYYSRQPATIAVSGDTPEIPEKYHPRITEYCLQMAYELDEDYSAAQIKERQFASQLGDMLETEKWTTRDFYPSITVLPQDW